MVNHIGGSVARLASRVGQEKYIIGGTGDEYWLAEEVWNDAWGVIDGVAKGYRWTTAVKPTQRAAIERLRKVLIKVEQSGLDFATIDNQQLVREHPGWQQARAAAQACLEEIGFDLSTWERDHLNGPVGGRGR